MLSTSTDFRARQLPTGVHLKSPEGRSIDVGVKGDQVTLQGDGFSHSIRVEGDRVRVASLDGKSPEVSFPKLAYLQDSKRVALGVAASLTGLPVNLFTGEKSEPVYCNLSNRVGMGLRRNGSREGGRYRVKEMERHINGNFRMAMGHGSITKGPNSYHDTPTAYLTTRSGRPLEMNGAFRAMTGTTYGEAFCANVTEFWRGAGKPGDAAEAAKVANYVFDLAYQQEPGYDVYRGTEHEETLTGAIDQRQQGYVSPESWGATWSILSDAAASGSSAQALIEALQPNPRSLR